MSGLTKGEIIHRLHKALALDDCEAWDEARDELVQRARENGLEDDEANSMAYGLDVFSGMA